VNEILAAAAKRANLDPHLAETFSHFFADTFDFDPRNPHAIHALAEGLQALAAASRTPSEVYLVPNLKEYANTFADDPSVTADYDGPVLLVRNPKAERDLAFAAFPGGRGLVVSVLPRAGKSPGERLGRVRNLEELPRFFDHRGFADAPLPPVPKPEQEHVAQAAALAYHMILEEAPEEMKATLEDFPSQVADEVTWLTGVEEFPASPPKGPIDPEVEALADKIATEAHLVLYMLYSMALNRVTFYLLDRLGRLVPDHASEPGVLAVPTVLEVRKSPRLRRAGLKLKVNYALPLRLIKTDRGTDAVISDAPYYFESKRDLDRLLRDLGGRPLPKTPPPTFEDIIDAILAKKGQPRP